MTNCEPLVYDDGECYSSDGIPCPHCHYTIEDDLFEIDGAYAEADGTEGETCCPKCGKDFTFTTSVSYSWKTKAEAKND